MMCPHFHVKKRTLLAIAGCVWLIAGVNVVKLGLLSYQIITRISFYHILLSCIVFGMFATMFYKMSMKHHHRIQGYREEFDQFGISLI